MLDRNLIDIEENCAPTKKQARPVSPYWKNPIHDAVYYILKQLTRVTLEGYPSLKNNNKTLHPNFYRHQLPYVIININSSVPSFLSLFLSSCI